MIENLRTGEFAIAQIAEREADLSRRRALREDRVEDMRRRLQGVDKSIHTLLDLAERYGAESAGDRLVQREAERRELLAKLDQIEAGEEAQRQAGPLDGVQAMLAEMRETLTGSDTRAQQVLLKKVVVRVKLGKEQGEVFYTSPCGLTEVPPGRLERPHVGLERSRAIGRAPRHVSFGLGCLRAQRVPQA